MFDRSRFTVHARGWLVLAGCLITIMSGCTTSGVMAIRSHAQREKALALMDQGTRLEKEGSLLLALERYDRAARQYECPEAYYRQGEIFEAQGKTQAAATAYNKALELAPDYREARLSVLALGYKPLNAAPTAEELSQARDHKERRATEIAQIRARSHDAETTTTAPEVIKGERMEVIEGAGQKRLPTTQEVAAVLFAPEAGEEKLPSATNPGYANQQDIILATYPYHYQKARAWRARQLYDRAAEEYENALRADPRQIDARIELGDMLMRLGRSDRARFHYEHALQDFPDSPVPLFKLGRYYSELNQPDRARDYYNQALKKDPKYVEAYNNLGVMDMKEEKFVDAAKIFDKIIQLDSNYANAFMNRGIIASDIEKNKDLALRCFKRYVELNGPRPDVRRWISDMENETK